MPIEHDSITDPEIHEPKGASTANQNEVYIADGAASGAWAKPEILGDGWADLIGSITASNAGTLNAPDFIKAIDNGAGSQGVYAYAFDPTTEEEVFLVFHIGHDYKVGTNFYPHVHWAPTTTNTGTVRWGVEWTYANRDDVTPEVFGATTITYFEQAANGVALSHQLIEIGDPGITLTDCAPDTIILARFFRDATHANDTYTGDALAFNLDAHYQIDRYATPNRAPDFYA